MGETAALVCQDPVVGILRRKFGHADAERPALLHTLEDEIDAVGILLLHPAQCGQDVILFASSFFGPFRWDFVVAGVRLDPAPVVVRTLAEDFLDRKSTRLNSSH